MRVSTCCAFEKNQINAAPHSPTVVSAHPHSVHLLVEIVKCWHVQKLLFVVMSAHIFAFWFWRILHPAQWHIHALLLHPLTKSVFGIGANINDGSMGGFVSMSGNSAHWNWVDHGILFLVSSLKVRFILPPL